KIIPWLSQNHHENINPEPGIDKQHRSSIIQPTHFEKSINYRYIVNYIRFYSMLPHFFKYVHSLVHQSTLHICIYQYVENMVVRYNTIPCHQIEEICHIIEASFFSIPMKHNRVGEDISF
ncbi:hypothetical protein U9M48_032011, partial [Paspalum notatum var. saurae]